MCITVYYIFKHSRPLEIIYSFMSITAASGRPLFKLQTNPDFCLVVGAKHHLRKNNKKWQENTLKALWNEFTAQLENIRINVDVLHLHVPHQLPGHLQTTSISRANIRSNYVCCVNTAFLECFIQWMLFNLPKTLTFKWVSHLLIGSRRPLPPTETLFWHRKWMDW